MLLLPGQITHHLSGLYGATRRGGKTVGLSQRSFSGLGNDTAHFARPETISDRKKVFWATVNRAALGGKHASGWRKAWGVLTYPYQFVKHAILWLLGKKEGFKTLHPLAKESRSQIMDRIEALNRDIKAPTLRFNFSKAEIEKAGVHKNHLLKTYDSLLGLKNLLAAKNWHSTAQGLEQFLSANGKNNSQSCANISFAHSQKLSNGAPIKRRKIPEALVSFDKPLNKMFITSPALESCVGVEREKLMTQAEKRLLDNFRIQGKVREAQGTETVEKVLSKPGSQALLFDLVGETSGHVTLAVNIKGQIYHIDNLNEKSAHVSDLKKWHASKKPDRLWYALSKDEIHSAIARS